MKNIPELREKQVGQLAFYMANPRCLDLSDPGTGKTAPCCVYAYWNWARNGNGRTFWSMPKSLLIKNLREVVRFTEFNVKNFKRYTPGDDVAILKTDHLAMTKGWTGPTIEREKRIKSWPVTVVQTGEVTDTYTLRRRAGAPVKFWYRSYLEVEKGRHGPPAPIWRTLDERTKPVSQPDCPPGLEVRPKFKPDGRTPERKDIVEKELARDLIQLYAQQGVKVVIFTFAFMSEHYERLLEAFPDAKLLLVDELHMPGGYSTPTSKATESFYWVMRKVERFVGMTGTLINGRLDSAYPAIQVIEPRYYGSLQGFYFEHAAVVDDYDRVILWKNEAKLRQIVERHSIRRTFEEVYGKEDVVFFTEYVDLNDKLQEAYDQFEEQAMLELENGAVLDGTMPGVALIRARQIMAHPETLGLAKGEETAKDERLRVHLAEGVKCLIFAALKPEQERIVRLCRDLGLRAELINSDTPGPRRARIDEMAQRGELDVIVGSGPTVAVGYNWEMFDHVIFASLDYQDTNVLQAYRRANRGGRTTTLRVTFLRYRTKVETRIFQIVTAKSQLANRVDENRPVLVFEEAA